MQALFLMPLSRPFMIDAPPMAAASCITPTGAQYVSIKYSDQLAEAGIEPSVGSVGDSYDNALAETINGRYKADVIHRRLLEPIGNIPPAEAEERYYAMLDEADMAAQLK
jgi:putative transposase